MDKFIVLPNAMYGNWVSALNAYKPEIVDSLIDAAAGGLKETCRK